MSINRLPLISIAMTVFYAAQFLTKSLESLLAQDYRNLELIISDNARKTAQAKSAKNLPSLIT